MTAVYPSTYRKRLYAGGAGLDGPDVAILSVLAHLAGNARDDGWFTVTQKEISERCGHSRDTVLRRLPRLERAGWIEIRETCRNGHYQASAYRLALPARVAESNTVHVAESNTVHVAESNPLSSREPQRVRSYSRESDSQRPPAAESPTPPPEPETETPTTPAPPLAGADAPGYQPDWRNPPPKNPATTHLLDELGIRRRKAQR